MKTINTDIERLFRAHYQEMYHLARCILMDDAESKDVVSEVFEQLLERPVVLVPKSETGYLMQAVRNRCRNVIAHKSMKERVKRLLTDDETSLSMMADDGIISRLAELIQQLEPPLRRQIVTLRFAEEQTYQEVASTLGISKVTVYNHLSAALRQLKQQLNQRHQFPRIAAVITGGVLIAGLAVAAVMKLEVLTPSKMESKTVTTQVAKIKTVAKDTVSASPKTQTDTLNVRPKVFDDVPLSRILTDMAAYYHKEWKDDAGAMTDIRLYFVWDRRKSLDENVRMLNNFSRFEITVEGNVIMVR